METKIQFPSYIGFGKLNTDTIRESENTTTADYFFLDRAVHRVTHNEKQDSWTLQDIFEDEGNQTFCSNPDKLALLHFLAIDFKTSPIFDYVVRTVCHRGNIYFEYPPSSKDKDMVMNYHPAGRMLLFRLPFFMSQEGHERMDILVKEDKRREEGEKKKLLKLNDSYNTSILVTKRNGEKEVVPVVMMEYLVPLAFVYDAADWICSRNLISREKIFRIIIQDSVKKTSRSMQSFQGNNEYEGFTILFKGFGDKKIDFEDFEKKFVEAFNCTN